MSLSKNVELKSVEIVKTPSYSSTNPNQYVARVKFATDSSENELLLTPAVSAALMAYLGPLLVKHATEAAQAVASSMQASIEATTQPLLEAPAAPASEAA